MGTPVRSFPTVGLSAKHIAEQLDAFKAKDIDWRAGKLPLFVFHADDEVYQVSHDAFDAFFSENAQGVAAFPGVADMQDAVTDAALSLLNAPPTSDAIFTSGGTESIFLAVHCAREHARAGRGAGGDPNIVLPWSGHPAFDKAARYLDLSIRRAPLTPDFSVDPQAMADLVDDDTMMIVGSAPGFPHGIIDPIKDIAELAQSHDVWMHVDACVGGYLAPFVRHLGYPVPAFDFSVPGVQSMSADLHKYGYAAKPASTVLFRDALLSRHALFEFDAWPRGIYRSRCFQGTRPAGAVASAWAVLNHLGFEGYVRHARTLMEARDRLIRGIAALPQLHVQGDPTLGLISYGSETTDIRAVGDVMEEMGWFIPRNADPAGIQFMVMPVHAQIVDRYLEDLATAVDTARGARPVPSEVVY